jgi:hypothetical protein
VKRSKLFFFMHITLPDYLRKSATAKIAMTAWLARDAMSPGNYVYRKIPHTFPQEVTFYNQFYSFVIPNYFLLKIISSSFV